MIGEHSMSKKSKIEHVCPSLRSLNKIIRKKKKDFNLEFSPGDFSSHFYYSLTNIKIEIFHLDCIVCFIFTCSFFYKSKIVSPVLAPQIQLNSICFHRKWKNHFPFDLHHH